MSGSEDESVPPAPDVALSGKRWRTDDSEGSQQSILKWMRHVPGPLREVMQKRADQLDTSQGDHTRIASATSDRYSVAIATVFDQGPWVDMCQYLGLPAVPGTLYGSIKMRSLEYTVQNVVDDDEAPAKVPQLLVLIKSTRYVDEEIVAVLHDPTGEVDGYFHRELVEHLGPALVGGVGVLLYKVSVFTPTDAPVTGRRKSYLNITPRNVQRLFVTKDSSNAVKTEDIVNSFNKEKEDKSQHESDQDDYEDNLESKSEQATRQLLQHSTVRDTSAELTFLSQRQVVHRNPPVRDPATVATTTKATKAKRGKKAAHQAPDHESGLGKWQWSKLLKKRTSGDDGNECADGSSCTQERQGFLDASSHLMSLITKQNDRTRDDRSKQETLTAVARAKKPVSVHFASETDICPPSVPRDADTSDIPPTRSSSQCLPAAVAAVANHCEKHDSNDNSDRQDDDDDDDW